MTDKHYMFSKNELETYNFRRYLEDILRQKQGSNPRYSLRSYAAFLQMDASTLKKILTGKRALGTHSIKKLGRKLKLSEEEVEKYVAAQKTRRNLGVDLRDDQIQMEYRVLGKEHAPLIATPYSYAILELTSLGGFDLSPDCAAKALRISEDEVLKIITLLKELNWIEQDESGKWRSAIGNTTVDPRNPETSDARRELMERILEASLHAYRDVPEGLRIHSANTFAIQKSLIPEVLAKIKVLTRELQKMIVDKSAEPDEIYQFQLGFFPISRFFEVRNTKSDG